MKTPKQKIEEGLKGYEAAYKKLGNVSVSVISNPMRALDQAKLKAKIAALKWALLQFEDK